MADQKITQLTADTSPTADDVVVTVNDPLGTPANRQVTLANIGFGIVPAWTAWSPTLANLTIGSGTVVAEYVKIGFACWFRVKITLSSSTMGTAPSFTLPFTATGDYAADDIIGTASLRDANGSMVNGMPFLNSTTVCRVTSWDTNNTAADITATAPFTWANSDRLLINGFFETTT